MFKDQFTVRLPKLDLEYLNEHWELLIADLEPPVTMPRVFIHICKKALAQTTPKTKEVSKPEDLQRIAELELIINGDGSEENRGLKGLVESRESIIESLESDIKTLTESNESLTLQIEETGAKPPEIKEVPVNLTTNQRVIEFAPACIPLLNETMRLESKRTGKEVTEEMILNQLFYRQATIGMGHHLPHIFSTTEVNTLIKNYQKELIQQSADNVE